MSFYVLDGEKLNANQSRVIGDTQFPKKWFLDAENRSRSGVVDGVVVAEPEHNTVLQQAIQLPLALVAGVWTEQWEVVERYDNQTDIDAALAAHDAATAGSVRSERDAKLAATDWTASTDVTMTPDMTTYRQALRDVPAQAGFPNTIDWPTSP